MGCFITISVQHNKKNNQRGDNGKKNLLWGQGFLQYFYLN